MSTEYDEVRTAYKRKMVEVFQAFIDICEEHNLQYFCHGGTAIGVVRHQGFIPWDDDIDVLMPRPDYERFLALFPTLNQNRYELAVPDKDSAYYLPFAKMCDARTTLLEFAHIPYTLGAFIDIFPLDGASSDPEERAKDWLDFRRTANKLMILPKPVGENIKWFFDRLFKFQLRTAVYELECAFNKKNKRHRILQKLRGLMTHHVYEKADYVGSYGSQFGVKAFWPKEWFSNYVIAEFEGLKVRIPSGYDKLLTQVYGDYMQLPPVEKQVSHHHVAYLNLDKRVDIQDVLTFIKK